MIKRKKIPQIRNRTTANNRKRNKYTRQKSIYTFLSGYFLFVFVLNLIGESDFCPFDTPVFHRKHRNMKTEGIDDGKLTVRRNNCKKREYQATESVVIVTFRNGNTQFLADSRQRSFSGDLIDFFG